MSMRSAEFRHIGGQRSLVERKPLPWGGSLPAMADSPRPGDRAQSPGTPPGVGHNLGCRQRGILSEVVRTHQLDEVIACRMGPAQVQQPSGHGHRSYKAAAHSTSFELSRKLRARAEADPTVTRKPQTAMEVLPKIMEDHAHRPGSRPRKVTVKQRQSHYSSLDIEDLLSERGVSFKRPAREHWFQLHDFDNTEYDIRTPEQWLEMGVQEDGTMVPLRATGLRLLEEGCGTWQECAVDAFDATTERFSVRWSDEDGQEFPPAALTRLQLLFRGEDPEVFADRLQAAFESLRRAEARARFNFFIDSMPTDDMQALAADQSSRILGLARNSGSLRDSDVDSAASDLLQEANLDFARTMNRIVFVRRCLAGAGPGEGVHRELDGLGGQSRGSRGGTASARGWDTGRAMLDGMDVDDVEDEGENPFAKPVPWYALWPVQGYSFTRVFSSFCSASLYIKPEVVSTLCGVAEECLWLLAQCMYATQFRQGLAIDHFRQIQRMAISQMARQIKHVWVGKLQKLILRGFENAGKGWFSIHETSHDTYRRGKMKKLLVLIRFMMQDTLRYFAFDSIAQYCEGIERFCPREVHVRGLRDVHTVFDPAPVAMPTVGPGSLHRAAAAACAATGHKTHLSEAGAVPAGARDPCEGLFLQELRQSEDGQSFAFSAEASGTVDACLDIFDLGLQALGDVPDVEASIVPQLFSTVTYKQVLNGIGASEGAVQERRAQLEAALRRTLPALVEYRGLLLPYGGLLLLDPAEYVQGLDVESMSTDDISNCAREHLRLEQDIWAAIPETAVVSMFEVSCAGVRASLAGHHRSISDILLELLLMRFRDGAQDVLKKFKAFSVELHKIPTSVEHAEEMREYMSTLPVEASQMEPELQRCIRIYDVLEEFGVRMTLDDVHRRWHVYGSRKYLNDLMAEVEEDLNALEETFLNDMLQEQHDFNETLVDLSRLIETFNAYSDCSRIQEIYENVETVNERLAQARAQVALFNSREVLFRKVLSDYSHLHEMQKQWEPFSKLWDTTYHWMINSKKWLYGRFDEIDAKQCEQSVVTGAKALLQTVKAFEKQEKTEKLLGIANDIKQQIEEFKPYLPIIMGLRNAGMRERHWKQVTELVGVDVHPEMENFTLHRFLEIGMLDHTSAIDRIGHGSGKELSLENQLKSMKSAWTNLEFNCTDAYQDTKTYILKGADDVMVLLDEQVTAIQLMQSSSSNESLKQSIDEWARELLYASECLDAWLRVQHAWIYLQPLFDSPEITKQLPVECRKFRQVDTKWRQVMRRVHLDAHALNACSQEALLEIWIDAKKDLDSIQRGLAEYLVVKRGAFARFYCLSNGELLEILSQAKPPARLQRFLPTIFEGVKELGFASQRCAVRMHSREGEVIDLVDPVDTHNKNVEIWMLELEDQMFVTVRKAIEVGVETHSYVKRTDWVVSTPGQAVLASSRVHWTAEVEQAIRTGTLPVYFQKLASQLSDLVGLVRSQITRLQHISAAALVVVDVHALGVVGRLSETRVRGPAAFEWACQLRYYWEAEDCSASHSVRHCWVRMLQTSFPYGYEYLGNSCRLVMTPLTAMCYVALMGVQGLVLGGAFMGPTGTGKTETAKDLARALAKQVVVFNCMPDMDYHMVGQLFIGLASNGGWCCLDDFNRIHVEILSVIAQQLHQLFRAKQKIASHGDTTELELDSTLITMKPTFNVIITMPTGCVGRSELPHNLAASFRPMAMMVPDYVQIAETSLYAHGFEGARHLAKKMVTALRLCSELLSAQCHYDFGMRDVKTVTEAAALDKFRYPHKDESQILFRAVWDVNVPRLLVADIPLFSNILADLFPGAECPQKDQDILEEACKAESRSLLLQPTEGVVRKQLELLGAIQVRTGVILLGRAGVGKTSSHRTLQRACDSLRDNSKNTSPFPHVHVQCINPKVVTEHQLYGGYNEATQEWSDGVAARLIRDAARAASASDHQWVMFDGPVDPLWVESMNTVLDDSRKLCLASGEVIALPEQVRFQFEVDDLGHASPATVSRCGVVFIEPDNVGCQMLLDSWLGVLPETFKFQPEYARQLCILSTEVLPPTLTFIRKSLTEVVRTDGNSLVQSLFRLLDCFFLRFVPTEFRPAHSYKEEILFFLPCLGQLFFFCLIWSLGASCDGASRKKFSEYVWAACCNEEPAESQTDGHTIFPYSRKNIKFVGLEPHCFLYDYFFSIEYNRWIPWVDTMPQYEVPHSAHYEDIIVPSIDSVRWGFAFQLLVLHGLHVLCPGPPGTGKSTNIRMWLQQRAPSTIQAMTMNFSARTHVNHVQDFIASKLEKRRRGLYGPPAGQQMVIFVDDLNLPQKEDFGAQPPLELVRHWHDHRGWHDRKDLTRFEITGAIMVSAMGPPGGGRTLISARLQRHYSIVAYPSLQEESINQMLRTISGHYFSQFEQAIQVLLPQVIYSTVEVFQQALSDMLPTPAKSHYAFDLRGVWKTFSGLCRLSTGGVLEPRTLVCCWCHEIQREFGDRLVSQEDLSWMKSQIDKHIRHRLGMDTSFIYKHERIMFAAFMARDAESPVYEEVTDLQAVKDSLEQHLEEYNTPPRAAMPLVLFLDACDHCARICRVLGQPGGNVLLLGAIGSGRKCLARLSSFVCNQECVQIESAHGYGMDQMKDDVKTCLMKCGVEDEVRVFLFCDSQIIEEDFLEVIHSILSNGDVPGLYGADDLEAIFAACQQLCISCNREPTKTNLFMSYLTRLRKNLHVVLSFSPSGDSFRHRLRLFPSLVTWCTIDWFHDWPLDALQSIAEQHLKQNGAETAKLQRSIPMFPMVHRVVEAAVRQLPSVPRQHIYVTPASYLDFISAFVDITALKREKLGHRQHQYRVALSKLTSAEQQVTKLHYSLVKKKPALEKVQRQVSELTSGMKVDRARMEVVYEYVAKEEAEARALEQSTQSLREQLDIELGVAFPALDAAVECVGRLKSEDIRELRGFSTPPQSVRFACEAISIMLGLQPVRKVDPAGKKVDDYWETALRDILVDPKKLMDQIMQFDKDEIPDKSIQAVTSYIESEDFNPAAIKKVSNTCGAMCLWVKAVYEYHLVARAAGPRREQLRAGERELERCTAKLESARAKSRDLGYALEEHEEELSAAKENLRELQESMALGEERIERAHRLISGLGDEKVRWGSISKQLTQQLSLLPGDCIIAAGMVAYAGPFSADVRGDCEGKWLEGLDKVVLAHTAECSIRSVLGDPLQIQQWTFYGLPRDQFSIENALIIEHSRRWPLMIDPQRQASKYVQNMGRGTGTGCVACKMSGAGMWQALELGIRSGQWVLLENVGVHLDPGLDPLLRQRKIRDDSGCSIKLGDILVPYADSFKFFMTTAMPSPHFSRETSAKVTLLNFAITLAGLEDQLLGVVVTNQRPDLEAQKIQHMIQDMKMSKQLNEIEGGILSLFSSTKGDVLEDAALVDRITDLRKVAQDAGEKHAAVVKGEAALDREREAYVPVAYRAAVLFFCIVELAGICPMYQYSLQWFQQLFSAAIGHHSPVPEHFDEHLADLQDAFTESLHGSICTTLFEKDKLVFSFALCVRILMGDDLVDASELHFLLAGPSALLEGGPHVPAEWVGNERWTALLALSLLPAFKGFEGYFIRQLGGFKKIDDSMEAEKERLPGEWNNRLTRMQRLCFIRAMRIDCLKSAIVDFISEEIGPKFVEPATSDIAEFFTSSTCTTPLLFILSAGADPVPEVLQLAGRMGMSEHVESISLGRGQGPRVTRMIESAQAMGGWVVLSNCHLMGSWMPSLEAIVEQFNSESMSSNFRLWLTSMPMDSFPAHVLQSSVKLTNEAPSGLRAKLLQAHSSVTAALRGEAETPEASCTLLFGLAFFHAVVLDRYRFGPIGWNASYSFTLEDLALCRQQLMLFASQCEEIPYRHLNFLCAEVIYGGRMTDCHDRRLASALLEVYLCPEAAAQGDAYSYSPSGCYHPPRAGSLPGEVLDFIRGMPPSPMPEAFGLHDNCIITCGSDEAAYLLGGIGSMISFGDEGESGKRADGDLDKTAASILDRMPICFPLDLCEEKFPTQYYKSLNTVLRQECHRCNTLLREMDESLRAFRQAIRGLAAMDAALERFGRSMSANAVPGEWWKLGPLSLKPLSGWFLDIIASCEFFQMWVELARAPPVHWISGFFAPRALITGAVQNYARGHGVAVDLLSCSQKPLKDIANPKRELMKPPKDGVYVYGFFLEGARWDRSKHRLERSLPKEIRTGLPAFWLLPVEDRTPNTSDYRCPCYRAPSCRGEALAAGQGTNFVLHLELPTDQPAGSWVRAGVAAFLALQQ